MSLIKRTLPKVLHVKANNYDYPDLSSYVIFIVDRCDAWVLNYRWHTIRGGYIACQLQGATTLVHRLILPDAIEVDHKDRNKLNNRRYNLRASNRSCNTQNTAARGKSGYRGVHQRSQNSFAAMINKDGQQKIIGHYPSAWSAACAYNIEALRVYGPYAFQNIKR